MSTVIATLFSNVAGCCLKCLGELFRSLTRDTESGCVCPSIANWSELEQSNYSDMCSGKKCSWIIPLGGNAFITNAEDDEVNIQQGIVTPCGLGSKWTNSGTIISVFFHSTRPGDILIALRLRVASGTSRIQITVSKHNSSQCLNEAMSNELDGSKGNVPQQAKIDIQGSDFQLVSCGRFFLPVDGYMRLDIQGLERSGSYFADVSHILVVPESNWFQDQADIRFCADPQEFYWSRRGPSVHLKYNPSADTSPEIEYFYTTLKAPLGQDVIGAYFCAAGFHGGYFGMQVNSSTERRILFSIWSAFSTDNPADIPQEYRVVLIKKGPGVVVGEFGDEGSGGQSYLVYPWVAGNVYRFLVTARPQGEDTVYTAWFNDPSLSSDWRLIASFRRPTDPSWLRGLYAFSENFIPEMGMKERQCIYGDQWFRDSKGVWTECTNVTFTADNTANQENRMDVCGGLHKESGQFFLRNCGFFSDAIAPGKEFEKPPSGIPPSIDFPSLP